MAHNLNPGAIATLDTLTSVQLERLDYIVRNVTAFHTLADMREAMDAGYVPTIYPKGGLNRDLILVLDWLGYDVWQGSNPAYPVKRVSAAPDALESVIGPPDTIAVRMTIPVGYFPMREIRPSYVPVGWDKVDTSHD